MTEEKKTLPDIDDEARRATTAAGSEGDGPSSGSSVTPRRAFTVRQKAGVAVVGALSVALIAVSVAFLFPAAEQKGGAESTSSEVTIPAAEGTGDAAADSQEAAKESAASADAVATQDAPPSSSGSEVPSSQEGVSPQSAAPEPSPEPSRSAPAVTVSVGVSSSAVGNPVSGGTTAAFDEGATAYDALMACGLSVTSSQFGVYVSAIGGLAEKEHGATSGWMYSVNGTTPSVSCSSYVLQSGDNVQWFYTT